MVFVSYFISALIAFSGFFAGIFLARAAKEEMPTASRHFPLMQKVILFALAGVFFRNFSFPAIVELLALVAFAFLVFNTRLASYYWLLAFPFFVLGQSPEALFSVSALVFLYGFPAGSLFVIYSRKARLPLLLRNAFLSHVSFLVVAISLQILYRLIILKDF